MELDKIYGSGGIVSTLSARRNISAKEDTSDTFARMLQNFKEMKAAEARDWSEKVGDTVITRILADGTVITQIYEGTKLVSQIVTRGSHPEAGKDVISETIEKMKLQAREQIGDPLLLSKAAQGSAATAAAVSAML
jgi:hypothetical protein